MAYAASRYTEVRLESICNELFTDINKNTVKFVDNYDGELKEPTLLPAAFPSILVTPNQGIAVGMASNICSFNLREVCEATIAYMKDENTEIIDIMPAPDFSLGASIIYDREEMNKIYQTGRGSFKMRAKYHYDKSGNCIEITQIPYSTTSEAIIGKIMELLKANKLREIADARDETDLNGFKIALDLKRGTDPDALMLKLYKLTPLEDSFACNFNILIDSVPRVMGVKEILSQWVKFRMTCIKNGAKFDIEQKSKRLHLLMGLKKILLDIDKAISIIRHTELDSEVIPNLMTGFGIDELQAEYISEIKLRNLNKEYILKNIDNIDKLTKEIADLNKLISSERMLKNLIAKQLNDIAKKYGQDRKTDLIGSEELTEYKAEEHIEDYPLTIFFTRGQYLKKVSAMSLKFTTSEHKLREDDQIILTTETTNKSELLFFSDKCNVYKVKTYDIADTKVTAMGEYLPGILDMEPDEKIIYTVVTKDFGGFMLFTFENGKVAKVELNNYETKTNRKKLIGAYSAKSPICDITFIEKDTDIVIFAENNKIACLNTSLIPLKTTKSTQGVQVIRQPKQPVKPVRVMIADQCPIEDVVKKYPSQKIPTAAKSLKDGDGQISLEY
jgi:DNA gyrase subunit A